MNMRPEVHLIHFLHDDRFARHIEPLDYVSLRTGKLGRGKAAHPEADRRLTEPSSARRVAAELQHAMRLQHGLELGPRPHRGGQLGDGGKLVMQRLLRWARPQIDSMKA